MVKTSDTNLCVECGGGLAANFIPMFCFFVYKSHSRVCVFNKLKTHKDVFGTNVIYKLVL